MFADTSSASVRQPRLKRMGVRSRPRCVPSVSSRFPPARCQLSPSESSCTVRRRRHRRWPGEHTPRLREDALPHLSFLLSCQDLHSILRAILRQEQFPDSQGLTEGSVRRNYPKLEIGERDYWVFLLHRAGAGTFDRFPIDWAILQPHSCRGCLTFRFLSGRDANNF